LTTVIISFAIVIDRENLLLLPGPPGTLQQAGVHDDTFLDLQFASPYLSIDHIQKRLCQTLLMNLVAKTADGGIARRLMTQGKAAEMAEGNTIFKVSEKLSIRKAAPGLRQQGFEHTQGGIGRIAHRIGFSLQLP